MSRENFERSKFNVLCGIVVVSNYYEVVHSKSMCTADLKHLLLWQFCFGLFPVLPEALSPSNGSSNNTFPPDDGSPPGNFGPNKPFPDDQPPTTVVTGRDISKRHYEADGSDDGGLPSKKDIRCGHISAPILVQLM